MPRAVHQSTLTIGGTPSRSFRFKITEGKDSCQITIDYDWTTGLFSDPQIIGKPDAVFVKCSDCGSPATHPSGLCRDCHQAKVEAEED